VNDVFTTLARTTDPVTSHMAAASLKTADKVRTRVLGLMKGLIASTHHELIATYRAMFEDMTTDSSIRTRCKELVAAGYIENSGRMIKLPSGRSAIVWSITNQGRLA
jgi:hypothetical protein